MKQPRYLVVGHVAKDVAVGGFSLGGSAIYAALAAVRLGQETAVVTACQPEIDLKKVLYTTPVTFAPSLTSTIFENIYHDGQREQYLHSRAADLKPEHVPFPWRKSTLVHIAPIAQEFTPEIIDTFEECFIGLSLQGWLRAWDQTGRVFFKPWPEAPAVLPRVRAVVLSEEDVDFREDVLDYFATLAPVVAVTLGDRGAKVYRSGRWHRFPAFRARDVDPTGAGDVFAAAFFYRLQQTNDPFDSAVFANCAASFCVEAVGTAGIPTTAMVEMRLRGAR